MKKLSLYVFLVLMFCNNSISDTVFTPQQVRTMNKEKLNELEIGMYENVVLMIMGSKTIKIESAPFTIENPFKIEIYSNDVDVYKILYFYTDLVKRDGFITDEELTPIIFKNNKLIGWGRDIWNKIVESKEFVDPIPLEPVPAGSQF